MQRWTYLLATVLLAAFAATGCGMLGGSSSAGAPIKLGFSAWPGWFPWQVAEEAGIFKEADELWGSERVTVDLHELDARRQRDFDWI